MRNLIVLLLIYSMISMSYGCTDAPVEVTGTASGTGGGSQEDNNDPSNNHPDDPSNSDTEDPNPDGFGDPSVMSLDGMGDLRVCFRQNPDTGAFWYRLGTPVEDVASGIVVDGNGVIYVNGWTYGDMGQPRYGGSDVFTLSLNPRSASPVNWIRTFGGPGGDWSNNIRLETDPDGNPAVWIAGCVEGVYEADTMVQDIQAPLYTGFVAYVDVDTGDAHSYGLSLVPSLSLSTAFLTEDGTVMTWGVMSNDPWGTGGGGYEGEIHPIVAGFTPDGQVQWVSIDERLGSIFNGVVSGDTLIAGGYYWEQDDDPGSAIVQSISLADGSIRSTMTIQGTVDYGILRTNDIARLGEAMFLVGRATVPLEGFSGQGDAWVARMDEWGSFTWALQLPGAFGQDIAVSDRAVYVLIGEVDGPLGTPSPLRLVALDPETGTRLWERLLPYTRAVFVEDIAVHDGMIYVTGSVNDSIDGCPAFGDRDIFVYAFPEDWNDGANSGK